MKLLNLYEYYIRCFTESIFLIFVYLIDLFLKYFNQLSFPTFHVLKASEQNGILLCSDSILKYIFTIRMRPLFNFTYFKI